MRRALALLLFAVLWVPFTGCQKDPSTPAYWTRALERAGGASDRVRLIEELGSSGHADATFLEAAHGWLRDEPHARVQTALVQLLVRIGDPSSLPVLEQVTQLKEPNADAKRLNREIAKAVGALADPAGAPLALRLLGTRDPYVRIAAIEALAVLKVPSTAAALEQLAEDLDVDPFLSHKAVEALGEIGAESSVPVLIRMMFHERAGAHFYPASAFALYRYGPTAKAALLPLFRGEEGALRAWAQRQGIREAGLYARTGQILGDLHAREAEPLLLERLGFESENPDLQQIVRMVSADALGRMGSTSAAGAIAAQLEGLAPTAQRQFLRALIRVGGTEGLPAIRATASSPSWDVRETTARALALLGGEEELAVLETMLEAESRHVTQACRAAEDRPECDDVPALTDSHHATLQRHLATLKASATVKGADGWKQKLTAPEPGLRERAAIELGTARAPGSIPLLAPLAADPDLEVRAAVLHALDLLTDTDEVRREARAALPDWTRQLKAEQGQPKLGASLEDLRRLIVKVTR